MKKIMVLVCMLGLYAAAYAQMGSPIWDAQIMTVGNGSYQKQSEQKPIKKEVRTQQTVAAEVERATAKEALHAAILAELDKQVKEADSKLKTLMKENSKYKEILSEVIKKHDYVAETLARYQVNDSFFYQACGFALEDLAAAVNQIGESALKGKVKEILAHDYYYAYGSYTHLSRLNEIAEDVADGFNLAGNGVAEVTYGDFYKGM